MKSKSRAHLSWKARRRKAIWSNPTFRSCPVDRQRQQAVDAATHSQLKQLQEQLRNNRSPLS